MDGPRIFINFTLGGTCSEYGLEFHSNTANIKGSNLHPGEFSINLDQRTTELTILPVMLWLVPRKNVDNCIGSY